MISYKALTSASTILEAIDESKLYESEIFSSNGSILYPYDLETTLTGVIYEDLKDVTEKFDDIRWTIWSNNSGEYEVDQKWNDEHKGKNPITVTKDEINSKAIIQFEAYKNLSGIPGDNTLVACSRISIVDTNDLLSSGLKPDNPYVGQVWIDSSTEPATMWMWNGTKWVQIGTVTSTVKNLLRNSAFWTYNYKHFDIVGDTTYSFTPIVTINNNKKWLNLVSDTEYIEPRGISQTTDDTEKIYLNDTYSFQFLIKNNSDESDRVIVHIYSINSSKEETLIFEEEVTIRESIKHYFTTFKTLSDTINIKVEILGMSGYRYNFYITELALFNTGNVYPWEPSPYDSEIEYDSEALFNALTYNGKIQGIYSMIDPKTGQLQYYFNASYIQSGTIKGDYIDAKNLVVRRDSDNIKTLEIDEHGNVNLVVNKFILSATNQTIEDFVFDQLDQLTPEQLKYFLLQIEKDNEQTEFEYDQYYNNDVLAQVDYDGSWSDWLDQDMIDRAKNENDDLVNIKSMRFNANKTVTLKDSNDNDLTSFYLGQAKLSLSKLGLGSDEPIDGSKLKKLLYYTHLAYYESYERLVDSIHNKLDEKSSISTFSIQAYEDESSMDDNYTDYSTKNALLHKLFVLCDDYVTDKKLSIVTDEWADFKIEADKIITEVGSIKSLYKEDTLLGAIGSIANEKITADSIINTISEGVANPDNKEIIEKYRETILDQTAKGFDMTATDYQNKMESSFKLASDGIMIDSNGSLINMNNEKIILASDNIDLEGYVTFKKLESKDPDDTTIIDGGYIKTDTMDAKAIKTGTLSADQITTGKLSNKDSTSIFDLDNGSFMLGDKLKYENGTLSFSGVNIKDSYIELDNSLPIWVQKWDTNKTVISGEEIVSPRAFFGSYEPESESGLTGIALGIDLESRNTPGQEGLLDAGIVGYYCNEPSFRLNIDGTAQFGRDTDEKKVYIDNDGALHFSRIDGNEINAKNLIVKNNSNTTTLSIDNEGEVLLNPKAFYLYNGVDPAIKLENEIVTISADYITTGKMSAGCLNVTDGTFVVKDENNNITFSIDENSNVTINPNKFILNSTNGSVISLVDGVANINANAITTGELDGHLIKSDSIETASLLIGDASNGINNLTKRADWYECKSTNELNSPTIIEDCTLGKAQYDKYYDYSIDYTENILNNNEKVFIQIDLRQFYNVTASKIYFKDKDSKIYYYKIKYSIDNEHWHNYYSDDDDQWLSTTKDDKGYSLDLKTSGVTAKYFRLYLNGNNTDASPATSSISAWELYSGGATTSIDASGIITGQLTADKISTGSISTSHINISDDNFSFNNEDKIVFAIIGEDEDHSSVVINPDTFILGTTEGDAIILEDNKLSINASYIDTGEINADLITTGHINSNVIEANSITSDKINVLGLTVTRQDGDNTINTFEVTNDGKIIVDSNNFLIKNSEYSDDDADTTIDGAINAYNRKLSEYIEMKGDTITLGKNTGELSYRTVITSEKLSFMNKNTEVAYISSSKMYIMNAEIKNKFTVGTDQNQTYQVPGFFDFEYRTNGHLSLKWRNK